MNIIGIFKKPAVIIGGIVVAVGGYFIYQNSATKAPTFTLVTVRSADIAEHVTATGSVAPPARFALSFERQGIVAQIPVKVGQIVNEKDVLVVLDSREADNALARAKANESAAYAKLKQVTDGTRAEEIYLAETALKSRQAELDRIKSVANASVDTSSTDLETTRARAAADIAYDYENGIAVLRSNIGKLKQSLVVIDRIRRNYFESRDTIIHGAKILEIEYVAEANVKDLADKIALAVDNNYASIDAAFAATTGAVGKTLEALRYIRNIAIEDPLIRDTFPTGERSAVETERAAIEAIDTAITTAKQNIQNQLTANQAAIDAAAQKQNAASAGSISDITRAQSAVAEAEAQLRLKRSGARSSDVNLALAELDAARSSVADAVVGVAKTKIIAPVRGVITDIAVDVGEVVGASTNANPVISMISAPPYDIEANVAEIDIPKLQLGNPIEITFDAFPDKEFSGHVTEMYPAETVVQGVIYYRVKASFDDESQLVKPGMTANLKLVTKSKQGALLVPYSALIREGKKDYVRVPTQNNTSFERREVQLGIQGDTEVEVLSGVKEGESVITFIKENP